MNQKHALAITLLLLVAFTFLSGYNYFTSNNVYSDHKSIADSIKIVDNGNVLTCKPVDHSENVWGQGLYATVFINGKKYRQSTWLFQRYGDTELVMTIWGPGEDGETYNIELGRVGILGPAKVYFNDNELFTIPEKTYSDIGNGVKQVTPGAYVFTVKLHS